MSVSGRFHHGGRTRYSAYRRFREAPTIWHYNQGPEEYATPEYDETRSYLGEVYSTWPPGSSYPDHFLFGDPHVNYYEGTAAFDDLKLYLPE